MYPISSGRRVVPRPAIVDRLLEGARGCWRVLSEPMGYFRWKPPVTATLAWNLVWVALYACILVTYSIWTFQVNDNKERVRSLAYLETRSQPLWDELHKAYEQALPTDMPPQGDPRPTLAHMLEKSVVSLAFYLSPDNRLTIARRHWQGKTSSVAFDEVDLDHWQPSGLLLADSGGPRTAAFRNTQYQLQAREEFVYAVVKSGLERHKAPEATFETWHFPGRYATPYIRGSRQTGFLGFESYGIAFPGASGNDILVKAQLQDQLAWSHDTNTRRTSFSSKDWLPGFLHDITLTPTDDGLLAADRHINTEAIWVFGLVGMLLLVRLNAATQDLRTLFNERSLALAQSNFVSAVSHEMRTPLTTIRMYAEMLEQNVVTDPERRQHYLHTIASEGERLGRLVENVLDYASISGRRKAYRFEAVDARELLDDALAAVAGPLEQAGLAVEVHAPVSVLAWVDRDAVVQSLINLLGNAIKYAATGNRLVLSAMPSDDGGVTLAIEDFGPGIEANEQLQVFKPFYRVGNELTRTTTGSGLGLALVAETAKAHQGRVELESQVGRGSVFRIVLPALDPKKARQTV
jgi:signal transduction histidine kinase